MGHNVLGENSGSEYYKLKLCVCVCEKPKRTFCISKFPLENIHYFYSWGKKSLILKWISQNVSSCQDAAKEEFHVRQGRKKKSHEGQHSINT